MSLSGRLAGLTGSVISDVPRLYSPYGVGQAVPAPDVRPPRLRVGAERTGLGGGGGTPPPHQRGLRPLWTLPPERLWSPFRRGARPCARPRSPRSPAADPPTPTPRRGGADRVGGGYPHTPTKEGYALSGLSRRSGSGPRSVGAHGRAPVPGPQGRLLQTRPPRLRVGAERIGFGGFSKPLPKRAAPSLNTPARSRASAGRAVGTGLGEWFEGLITMNDNGNVGLTFTNPHPSTDSGQTLNPPPQGRR